MSRFQYVFVFLCVAGVVETRADDPIESSQRSCDLLLPMKGDYVVRLWSQPIDISSWLGDKLPKRSSARTRWIDVERVSTSEVKMIWHDLTDTGSLNLSDLTVAPGEGDTIAIAGTRFQCIYFRVFDLNELDRSLTIPRKAEIQMPTTFVEQESYGPEWFFPLQPICEKYPSRLIQWPFRNQNSPIIRQLSWENGCWTLEIRLPRGRFVFTRSQDANGWTLRGAVAGTLPPAVPAVTWPREDMERLGLPTAAEGESRPPR